MLDAVLHELVFLAIGAAIGFLGGLFGIGGAILVIPVLALFFGLSQQIAQGTALLMGVPIVAMGLWRYAQHPNFNLRGAGILAATATPFVFGGAWFALNVAGRGLRPAFAAFLVALALWMSFITIRRASAPPAARVERHPILLGMLGAVSGAMSGIFSSGGAALAVPALSTFFGYAQASAQGMALGLIGPGSFVSLITYGINGAIDWAIGIPLAIGGMLFIKQGVALAHRLPEVALRLLFSLLLIASATALFHAA